MQLQPQWSRIGEALRHCSRVESLRLHDALLTTKQLYDCLEQMPLLSELSLCSVSCSLAIRSLRFLRAGRLSLSLEDLTLSSTSREEWQLQLPFDELAHVESLQALRDCGLEGILVSPFTEEQKQIYDQLVERNTWPRLELLRIEGMAI